METRLIFSVLLMFSFCGSMVEAMMADLTHYFDNHTIRWPGHKPWIYNIRRGPFNTPTGKELWLESNDMSTAEHMGTHLDAPAHLLKGMWRLDEIPLENLIRPLVVIDVRDKAKQDREYGLTIDDVTDFEALHGRIPDGAAVFMWTGYDEFWLKHDRNSYLGTEGDDIWSLHFPGFHPDTAEWLMNNRKIKGIGSDCVSFDIGSSKEFGVHTGIFARNVWGLENVAHLGRVPATGATVHVMPMNIYQASGAPSRVVAFWGDNQSGAFFSAAPTTRSYQPISVLLALGALLLVQRMM